MTAPEDEKTPANDGLMKYPYLQEFFLVSDYQVFLISLSFTELMMKGRLMERHRSALLCRSGNMVFVLLFKMHGHQDYSGDQGKRF